MRSRVKYLVLLLAVLALVLYLLRDAELDPESGRAPEAAERAAPEDGVAPRDAHGVAPEAGAAPASQAPVSRWWLTLLGPGHRPLVDVPVTVLATDEVVRTDESGTAALTGPADAEFLAVGDPFTHVGRVLEEPRTVVRLPGLLPLEVEFRAVDTGEAFAPDDVRLTTRWGGFALKHGRLDVSPLRAGEGHTVQVVFAVPPGYTTLDGLRYDLGPTLSEYATQLRATVVLWPELELTVRAVDDEDRPVDGATVKAVYFDVQYKAWVHEIHVAAAPTDG
ncbi:MAG: hypothetical protein ACYTEZ_14495, partial [Planctomycetota bacterium]